MITIKSKTEIELMKKSGEIVAIAHEKIREAVRPGVTTLELDKIAEEYIIKCGAIPSFKGYPNSFRGVMKFPASICSSVNDEVVHGVPGLRVLKDGDIISIDIGACLNGYHSDAARTHPVGVISEKAAKLIKVTEQSFYEGIKFAVCGNRIVDISSAVQKHVEENGFSVVREYVGHGIGKQMHEPPQIPNYRTKERGDRLASGMTLAIEPMVNEGGFAVKLMENKWTVITSDGSLSAHYENTIAVTDSDPVILTLCDLNWK